MKIISLKTEQEIDGVLYKNNPSKIQEALNEPRVLQGGHSTAEEAGKYGQPLLITFNLCYFQKSNVNNNEYSHLFNSLPNNHFVVGVFNEVGSRNHIYILHDMNNNPVVLDENTLNNKVKDMTIRDFVQKFLLNP